MPGRRRRKKHEEYPSCPQIGDEVRFSKKGLPEEWIPGVVEDFTSFEGHNRIFYYVRTAFRNMPPKIELVGEERYNVEITKDNSRIPKGFKWK